MVDVFIPQKFGLLEVCQLNDKFVVALKLLFRKILELARAIKQVILELPECLSVPLDNIVDLLTACLNLSTQTLQCASAL